MIGSALDTLDKVRLVTFEYTDEYRAEHPSVLDRRYMNVIAQEFAEVFPDHVKGSGEKMPGSDEEILQVDPYPLTIYSAAAIQELHQVVKSQEARIAELEAANRNYVSPGAAGLLLAFGVAGVSGGLLRRRSGRVGA